jgi:hypothetical protein
MEENSNILLIIGVMILLGLPSLADASNLYIVTPQAYRLWRIMVILFFIFMISLIIKC